EPEHPPGRTVDRDDEEPVISTRPEPRDGAHGISAGTVGDEPLPRRRLGKVAADLRAQADRQAPAFSVAPESSSPRVGTGRPRARKINSATSPVHPVWWLAPRPAPLSPWKYSLKRTLSLHAGSS